MKITTVILGVLLLAATTVSGAVRSESEAIISKNVLVRGDYCHLKFPAIREETLGGSRPALKDAASGDLIDFYGPCDHDPAGKDEIQTQTREETRRREAASD